MKRKLSSCTLSLVVLLAASFCAPAFAQAQTAPSHVFFRVVAGPGAANLPAGRLLVFVKQGAGDAAIDVNEMAPGSTWVAAREINGLKSGSTLEFDADETVFPGPLSELPAGDYEMQAVLDVGHDYNYRGRTSADWTSPVVKLSAWKPGSGEEPVLVLDRHPELSSRRAAMLATARTAEKMGECQLAELISPLLSRFWGREVKLRAWVILPPDYLENKEQAYPTAYWTHGFGGDLDGALFTGMQLRKRMKAGSMPPMIWVMLDESAPQGTHEFADSVNNGPWGTALTTEFIPWLEKKFRMEARPTSRLLNGHSSGGWATLQLQMNYPKIFGGTWSTSPDPSDFHDFTGVDLYAAGANLFRHADGSPVPVVRDHGKVLATFEQLTRLEDVLGSYGGQIASFDWVFSPKSASGVPEPLFDHQTGDVHPGVLAYWRDHYDLAHLAETHWAERGTALKGRIHLVVGTEDTFYLDGAARKLEAVLARLGGDPRFTYLPQRTHFDLYVVDKDPFGLYDQIGAEMFAVARPGVERKKN